MDRICQLETAYFHSRASLSTPLSITFAISLSLSLALVATNISGSSIVCLESSFAVYLVA